MFQATTVSSRKELEGILRLQKENLSVGLSQDEIQSDGFVTIVHTLNILEQLHALAPSVIILHEEELVGYALVMPVQARQLVPILEPMFQSLDDLRYENHLMGDYRYYVMGQVCVAKRFRGMGLFDQLYFKHRELFQHKFDFVITEIATRNTRSIRAHERVGFKILHTHRDEVDEWAVALWDWK